jgi:hypothetical protein
MAPPILTQSKQQPATHASLIRALQEMNTAFIADNAQLQRQIDLMEATMADFRRASASTNPYALRTADPRACLPSADPDHPDHQTTEELVALLKDPSPVSMLDAATLPTAQDFMLDRDCSSMRHVHFDYKTKKRDGRPESHTRRPLPNIPVEPPLIVVLPVPKKARFFGESVEHKDSAKPPEGTSQQSPLV